MSESEHLSEALTGLLLEEENGWFLPVFGALEGLSAEQAARSPAEKFNSPWSYRAPHDLLDGGHPAAPAR